MGNKQTQKVLVVDDEEPILELLKYNLEKSGYEVRTASDGMKAIDIAKKFIPDLVLLDIKTWDPERHLKLTGQNIGPTLDFARRLAARKRPVWLRFVLVPGLTDNVNDIAQIAQFAAVLGNIERVCVLPFHQMGLFKWKKLGLDYTLQDVESPSNDLVERTCALFRAEGLTAD